MVVYRWRGDSTLTALPASATNSAIVPHPAPARQGRVAFRFPSSAGMMLGIWQGIYLAEHRRVAHRRQVAVHLIGERSGMEDRIWRLVLP
ncbi:hypothetical protein TQ38_001970 [Novosphingobium sp. P6W]|nr:hypothetical protein TQ38_001970 [Novosphingobium sp. P6W]